MSLSRMMHPISLALLAGCAATAPNPHPIAAPAPPPSSGEHDGKAGQWEVTLGASGVSDKNVDAGSASGAAGLGLFLTDHLELALRQNATFFDSGASGSDTNASTGLAADINFGSGGFRPLIGASAGYVYGDTVRETWVGGPEAGFKIYVKQDVFLQLLAQYQFFFESSDDIDDQFDDGSFVYSLAFGINF